MKKAFLILLLFSGLFASAQQVPFFKPGNFKKNSVVQDAYGTHWKANKDMINVVSPPSSGALWSYVKSVPVISTDSLSRQISSLVDRVDSLEVAVIDDTDPIVIKPKKDTIYARSFLAATAGTGLQTAAFQNAIRASKGKVLKLPDNYIIRMRRVDFTDSIDIVGGINSVIGTDAGAPDHTLLFSVNGVHDIHLTNIRFDLSNVTNGNIFNGVMPISLENSYNITLTDLYGHDNKFGFIRFYNVHDVKVTRCTGKNMDSPFIHSGNTYNVYHLLNVADGGSSEGFTTAPLFPGEVLRNIYFDQCTVRNKLNSWAFGLHGMRDSWMKNCIADNSLMAVGLSVRPPVEVPTAEDQTGNNILITGCKFTNIIRDGVQGHANNTTISFNDFTNIGGTGINLHRVLVDLPAKDTIHVTGMDILFNTFNGTSQNVAADGSAGMWLRRIKNSTVKGNKITTRNRSRFGYGFRIELLGENVTIEANEIYDNGLQYLGPLQPKPGLRIVSNKYKFLDGFPASPNIIFAGNTLL